MKLKVYSDESCFQEINGIIGDNPSRRDETVERYVWIKNISPSMTLQDIVFKPSDSDVTVESEKTILLPFEKTKVTITITPTPERETSINTNITVSYNAVTM
jgi:hypothetical protein